ncbi:hypothetical protein VTL71DRAFT_2977 [Oculimacula yallundae]|uniref:Uncharacterized protein n=1 Tax=Oculimacula yallundae TaxID=86028 RepID=A0ABR4C5T9_9HELO
MNPVPNTMADSVPVTSQVKLTRLADILQEIYYQFRRKTFDSPLKNIEYIGGKMTTFDSVGKDILSIEKLLDLCDGTNDELTLLARYGCTQAVALMANMLVYGLKGIDCQVVAVVVKMKEPHRKFIRIDRHGNQDYDDPNHEFFKINVRDGILPRIYALDLSSAQYGYYKPLLLFQDYVDERVLFLKKEVSLVEVDDNYKRLVEEDSDQQQRDRAEDKRVCTNAYFYWIESWEIDAKIDFKDLIGLPEEDFCEGKKSLFEFLEKNLLGIEF